MQLDPNNRYKQHLKQVAIRLIKVPNDAMDLTQKVYRDISIDNARPNNSINSRQLLNEGMLIHFHKMLRHLNLDKDVQEDNNDKPNNENFVHHILQKIIPRETNR
jgi:hypothetical protein